MVSKYINHLPVYRQEEIFKRLSLSEKQTFSWKQMESALLVRTARQTR
ncbi:MAG: IS66 family transposase [Tannerella sp.]|nr:IS66 family transposase [Tannerella sp.]